MNSKSTMNSVKRVLLIEDDNSLRTAIEAYLYKNGCEVESTDQAYEGESRAIKNDYDCIVLDLALPDKNGLELCKNLREKGVQTPVLILSAHSNTETKITGLNLGADDYLSKPFDNRELLARIQAIVRRDHTSQSNSGKLRIGELEIDFYNRDFFVNGKAIDLTNNEFRLIGYMMKNPDRILEQEELSSNVWELPVKPQTNFINVYISYLRNKIQEHSRFEYIQTIRGKGFRLQSKS